MAIAVVISTVSIGTDGLIHVSGTVGGVAAPGISFIPENLIGLGTLAAIQNYLAVKLLQAFAQANNSAQPITALAGTVNL